MNIHERDPDTILFAGDWHGNIQQAVRVLHHAQRKDTDTVVQCGDFGYWTYPQTKRFLDQLEDQAAKRGITIYWVDGNHENFASLYEWPIAQDGTRPIRPHIIHLPRGLRWTWGPVRYVALGGAHSVDKHHRTLNESWWAEEWVTDEQIQQVIDGGQADVMIMHDSPEGAPNPVVDDPNNMGQFYFPAEELETARYHRSRLRPAVEAVDPVLIFHGHYHHHGVGTYIQPSGTETIVFSLDEGGAPISKHIAFATREGLQLAAESRE